eukprot:TRINITY_DN3025_c0_g1_i1.p1 TRINITY_DN3025_c0_g1~~TRINITY_DN3025_c0_g1_i1.p1  ORF type:complete len:599 (+),score=105.37 TRINITY_DN3025_c0_g1_i1:136-1932(+)
MERPPTAGSMAGGMAYGGMRPPSGGMRPPSGGMAPQSRGMMSRGGGTGYGGPMAGMGNALNEAPTVTLRPVMNQGMQGISPGSAQPRRQVADRSYYLGLLRGKITELSTELERLNKEGATLEKNSTAMSAMDKKVKGLKKGVAGLKNHLSDLNFTISKAQAGAEIQHINEEAEDLKIKNKEETERADNVFLQMKAKSKAATEIEEKIKKKLDEVDDKLKAEPEKRAKYYQLREQSDKLRDQLLPMQKDLDLLQRRFGSLKGELNADAEKQQALKLQERKSILEKKKADILEEIANSETGQLPDEKTRLLTQVKVETNEIEKIQKAIDDAKDSVASANQQIHSIEEDLQQYKGMDAERYKELEKRELEMQDFFDKYDDMKSEVTSQIAKTEENIVSILENIGKVLGNLQSKEDMPSQQQVEEMNADLNFKKQQMDYSVTTHQRLKNELELRKKELEKVNNLDSKITSELEAITQKIRQHEDDIKKFSNLEALRVDADTRKKDLQSQRVKYNKLRDALKQNVTALGSKFEETRKAMTENEVHASLQAQEQKIRLIQQNVFTLTDFIAQKGAETDYHPLKADCLQLVGEINKFIKEQNQPK